MSQTTHTHGSQSYGSSAATASEPDGEGDKPPSSWAALGELAILEALRRGLRRAGHSLDTSDDCAWLELSARPGLVLTTDALVEGLHFDLAYDSFTQVGRQAAVVNLSDLAASGAWPVGLMWSLSSPPKLNLSDFEALSEGFGRGCRQFDAPILGGNICVRPGPLELHVSALGAPLSERGKIGRSGAQPHDGIYVTGALGSRALGYLSPSPSRRDLRHGWRPHLEEARALCSWGEVSAMMDISDGLLIDLERLTKASGVGAQINSAFLPLDDEAQALASSPAELLEAALSGGEDYVLLFTAPTPPPSALNCTRIGRCVADLGLMVDGVSCDARGYLHGATTTPQTSPSLRTV